MIAEAANYLDLKILNNYFGNYKNGNSFPERAMNISIISPQCQG